MSLVTTVPDGNSLTAREMGKQVLGFPTFLLEVDEEVGVSADQPNSSAVLAGRETEMHVGVGCRAGKKATWKVVDQK